LTAPAVVPAATYFWAITSSTIAGTDAMTAVEPNGRRVQWELINIFRYTDEGCLVEEWVQTDAYDFLRQLGAVGS